MFLGNAQVEVINSIPYNPGLENPRFPHYDKNMGFQRGDMPTNGYLRKTRPGEPAMTNTFTCPTCGAPLEHKGGPDLTITCPFCGSSVIVPPELRSAHAVVHKAPPDMIDETAIFQSIRQLLESGNKIRAVELYRNCYPVGLAEAKNVVDGIEAGTITSLSRTMVPRAIMDMVAAKSSPGKNAAWLGLGISFLIVLAIILIIVFFNIIFKPKGSPSSASQSPPPSLMPTATPFPTNTPSPTPMASLVLKFGGEGMGAGKFHLANDIYVDRDGLMYVGDREFYRIQVFNPDGSYLRQFNINPKDKYRYLAAEPNGNFYVEQAGKIYLYDRKTGERTGQISYTDETGKTDGFGSMVVLPNGNLAATWDIYDPDDRDDLLIFDRGGKLVNKIENALSGPADWTDHNVQLAADGLGNIYILGTSAQTVVKYSADGKFLTRFGSRGTKPGQFDTIQTIAIDSQGRVYLFGNTDLIFDTSGLYMGSFTIKDCPLCLLGATFDQNDNLYISSQTEVRKYALHILP
jgi:hypothetical protein